MTDLARPGMPLSGTYVAAYFSSLPNEKTRLAYLGDIRRFTAFLGLPDAESIIPWLLASGEPGCAEAVLRWRGAMFAAGKASNTIRRSEYALGALLDRVRLSGLIPWRLNLKPVPRVPVRDLVGPTALEFGRLVTVATNPRDLAIVLLLGARGLRVGSISSALLADLAMDTPNPGEAVLTVTLKGGRREGIALGAKTAAALSAYLPERKADSPYLFTPRHGSKMNEGSIRFVLGELCEKAGLRHFHPHSLRRSFATRALDLGCPVRDVAAALNHRGLACVSAYDTARQADLGAKVARIIDAE